MDIRSFIPLPIGPTDTVSRNVYRYRWQTQRPFRSSDSESLPAYPPWAMFLRACWPRLLVPRRGRALSSESRGRSPKVLQRLLCCLQFRIFSVIACIAARVCLSWSRLSCHAFTSVVPASHAFTIARPRRGIACRTPLRSRVSDRRGFARYGRIPAACCGRCAC